jgi:hypothetical protein
MTILIAFDSEAIHCIRYLSKDFLTQEIYILPLWRDCSTMESADGIELAE